jgi:putative Mn2+ efflux pump MntP
MLRKPELTSEQAAQKAKTEKQLYIIMWVINITLLVASFGFFIAFIANIFKGNWPYAAGFAILTYIVWYIFRRVPWPETEEQKSARELRELLQRLGR